MIFLCPSRLSSSPLLRLPLSDLFRSRTPPDRQPVQSAAPIGDDGQLMSRGPPVLWLSTNAVQLTVPIGDDGQLISGGLLVLWLSTNSHAVHLTVPIGNDGQLMSRGPPVLWLSTNAVQLTVPTGDDGQLMSGGPPVLWLSTSAVQFVRRLRRAFPFFFCTPLLYWSDFCAPYLSVPQTFPHLFGASSPLVSNSRHFLDGGVFRQQGNRFKYVFLTIFLIDSSPKPSKNFSKYQKQTPNPTCTDLTDDSLTTQIQNFSKIHPRSFKTNGNWLYTAQKNMCFLPGQCLRLSYMRSITGAT